ncbi:MAG: hypothetical protein KDD03_07105 [Gelidibacter sp.]|nr:hypothetical protein [Gelidibacter sp.]
MHCDAVINLGSSMVFDFAIHDTPCLFMNYNYLNTENEIQLGVYVYNYVHFKSKPSVDVVYWLDHPDDIAQAIIQAITNKELVVKNAKAWFLKINQEPYQLASERIMNTINQIIQKNNNT